MCVAALAGQATNAATFDAAADFSPTVNPNGPWSYGTYANLDTPSTFATSLPAVSSVLGLAGFDGYLAGSAHLIAKNTTSGTISPGTPNYAPGALILHPSSTGRQAVVRWTAASAGTYDVDGGFFGTDFVSTGTTTDGSVYLNGGIEFSGSVNALANQTALFDLTLSVNAGDTIDFVVGWGSNGTFLFDSTELQATVAEVVAPVPLPAGLPLLASGLALLALRRRSTG